MPIPSATRLPERPPATPPPAPGSGKRQFSLRWMLAMMTVAALLLAFGQWAFTTGLRPVYAAVFYAAPPCLVTAAVFARGAPQAFFIGAATTSLIVALQTRAYAPTVGAAAIQLLGLGFFCALSGSLATVTRTLLIAAGWAPNPARLGAPEDLAGRESAIRD